MFAIRNDSKVKLAFLITVLYTIPFPSEGPGFEKEKNEKAEMIKRNGGLKAGVRWLPGFRTRQTAHELGNHDLGQFKIWQPAQVKPDQSQLILCDCSLLVRVQM